MNFPRFWVKGHATSSRGRRPFESWGWSNTSAEEAKLRAEEKARNIAQRFAATGKVESRRYYGDRPFREEVLETISDANSSAAIITRNSYGCQVLNTAGVMFIDVDLDAGDMGRNPATGETIQIPGDNSDRSWMSRFFGRPAPAAPPKNHEVIIERALEWAEANSAWGWRVYRTRAGLRFVATHQLFDPETMAVSALFDNLTADPLYRKLCQTQKCFRARLTPKPWRCDFHALTLTWPWANDKVQKRFGDWQKKYEKAAAEYSTCDLLATLGQSEPHPDIAPIIRVHDMRTKVGSGLPLA